MDIEELQSVGSDDNRSRQSSLASLADDLTKRSTFNHRLGLGLDRALANLHPPATAAAPPATDSNGQFLSTAAAVATGTASGFGSFRVPIQTEESKKKLSSLAESAGDADDAEDDDGGDGSAWGQAASTAAAAAPVVSDAPMLQVGGKKRCELDLMCCCVALLGGCLAAHACVCECAITILLY